MSNLTQAKETHGKIHIKVPDTHTPDPGPHVSTEAKRDLQFTLRQALKTGSQRPCASPSGACARQAPWPWAGPLTADAALLLHSWSAECF